MTLEVCDYLGQQIMEEILFILNDGKKHSDGNLAFIIDDNDKDYDDLASGDTVYIEGTYFHDLNASNSILTNIVTSKSGIKIKSIQDYQMNIMYNIIIVI